MIDARTLDLEPAGTAGNEPLVPLPFDARRPTRCLVRRLSCSVDIAAPSSFALAFLNTYFLERGPLHEGSEVSLRFPLPAFIIGGMTLEKRVTIELKYRADGGDAHVLTIAWRPLGNNPLPEFNGTLRAESLPATNARLTIAGAYTPPGGIPGMLFDQLIGGRIARATLSVLLDRFKVAIESDYAARLVP
jgi:hypothetical protein